MAFPKHILDGLKQEGYKRPQFCTYSSRGYYQTQYAKDFDPNVNVRITMTQYGTGPWTYLYSIQAFDRRLPGSRWSENIEFDGEYDGFKAAETKALREIDHGS